MANRITSADACSVVSSIPSNGSSRCSDFTDHKRATAVKTTVSRNKASGCAVQMNGPVAGTINNNNFTFKKLIINCSCGLNSRSASHKETARSLPSSALKTVPPREEPKVSIVEIPGGNQNLPHIPAQTLGIKSSSGRPQGVRATFQAGVPDNFIAHRIVNRLELSARSDPSLVKVLFWGGTPLPSTNDFVDLACYKDDSDECTVYRLYVIKKCPFDLLFGVTSIDSPQ
ncbi:hypothetical protein BU26DRAFT_572497 [Trematosphaeria pertusa]|uniref:Uncharacterized protein n=1 Tax=Trematosphaeria pertusa TaxID=390896 RepID=A0A6A6HSA8_9PLEO|nr:uncharacterized protein BU26DRAFT_572497 [Trematosphaeria pertusa]KAF2240901.1 hypothetical protein BU26DRAFT_572497 [Trematosphaeria pertusa]